ncbi:MAG: sulfite exporter TauE/SafE family protein [Chitinivibrionales bacterium]|nr:sulfite exporter TauE/SafE family protein [Chitinivibrionales bacterium]
MDTYVVDMGLAIWFGVLTSISPCPLATNIAAISFLGKQVQTRSGVLSAALFYTAGRAVVYIALAAALVSSAEAVPAVSWFLQKYMNMLLGPVLLVVGVVLLDIVRLHWTGSLIPDSLRERLGRMGSLGALPLGALFALSFCPVSAAFFFGSTFAVAMKHQSRLVMPSLFGLGSAAPVVVFGLVIAFSAHAVGSVFNKVSAFEKAARRISGIVFIGAGLYLTGHYTLGWF